MNDIRVTVDNFVRAETDRMFAGIMAANNVAINEWAHNRVPTPLDNQPVIRQNRDTLYSAAVVDISQGATLIIPEARGRYLSAMVVNQDHYINEVFHDAGEHELTLEKFDTPFVVVAVRILVDPGEPDDVSAVTALQDQLTITASSAEPFRMPAYEATSFAETRDALIKLSEGLDGYAGAFGRRDEVDPIRHLIGTASAWGGLPETEAFYQNVVPGLPVGAYTLTVRDVPVDGFWSVSLYDADGYFPTDTGGRSASTTSPPSGTPTDRSRSTSVGPREPPTCSRSHRAGTISSGTTSPARRSSTAVGLFRP
jgi:hypothetical protein